MLMVFVLKRQIEQKNETRVHLMCQAGMKQISFALTHSLLLLIVWIIY